MAGKIRVVIAKPGLDGHDRGAKIIARALRDAGMEVIYTGLHQTPEQIVETVIQEDADAVGISILSGAHMTLVPRILALLREQGAEDVLVVVGGTIPNDDVAELKQQGVAGVFTPGAPTSEIVEFLQTPRRGLARGEAVERQRAGRAAHRGERAGCRERPATIASPVAGMAGAPVGIASVSTRFTFVCLRCDGHDISESTLSCSPLLSADTTTPVSRSVNAEPAGGAATSRCGALLMYGYGSTASFPFGCTSKCRCG